MLLERDRPTTSRHEDQQDDHRELLARRPALRKDAPERREYSRGSLPDLGAAETRQQYLHDFDEATYAQSSKAPRRSLWHTIHKIMAAWGHPSPLPCLLNGGHRSDPHGVTCLVNRETASELQLLVRYRLHQ